MPKKITITEGEFAGWQTYDLHDTFDTVVGPFYGRPDPDGHMRCAWHGGNWCAMRWRAISASC